jgi:hypothetical protein
MNRAQKAFGIMLYAARTPRRVIEILSKIGLTQSYQTIQKNIDGLSKDARDQLQKLVDDPTVSWALLYDNINYMLRVKGQTDTHHNKMHNAIVGNIVVLDAEIALPAADHPRVSHRVFEKIMGPGMKRPTAVPRKACPGMSTLQRLPVDRSYD